MKKIIILLILSLIFMDGCTVYTTDEGGLDITNKLYCNGKYWADTCKDKPARIFKCDPILGGTCDWDATRCEEAGMVACKGTCWSGECEAGRKFKCDPVLGGTCDHDTSACEEVGRHPCKGTCWEGCPAKSTFICDDVRGGMCKQY